MKLTDKEFNGLRTMHELAMPQKDLFLSNVNRVVSQRDSEKMERVLKQVSALVGSYHDTLDALFSDGAELRKENERLKSYAKSQTRYMEELQGRSHSFQCETERVKSQLYDAVNTLSHVKEELRWGDADNAIDRMEPVIQASIQRMKGEGTSE